MKVDRILVPTDFSDISKAALDFAARLGTAMKAELLLLHVFDDTNPILVNKHFYSNYMNRQEMIARIERRIERLLEEMVNKSDVEISDMILRGVPSKTVIDTASEEGADLIVMGTRGLTGLDKALIGGTAERVVRHSEVPVVTVNRKPGELKTDPIDRLMCPVAPDVSAVETASWAAYLKNVFKASLDLIHVKENPFLVRDLYELEPFEQDMLDRIREETVDEMKTYSEEKDLGGGDTEYIVDFGRPYAKIIENAESRGTDMIIMSGRGRDSLKKFLIGSNTERVVRLASCPVMTVPD